MSVIEKSRKAIKEILEVKKRSDQYANYLATIDRLAKVRANLPGRISRTTSNYASAKIGSVGRNVPNTSVSMSRILEQYQDRALRIAQAKYYQKQAKA